MGNGGVTAGPAGRRVQDSEWMWEDAPKCVGAGDSIAILPLYVCYAPYPIMFSHGSMAN